MLARNVHLLRRERRLSLRKLANRAGLSPSTLWQIEQGKANPSVKVLEKLADSLSVSVFDLTGWKISDANQPLAVLAEWYKLRKDFYEIQEGDLDALSQIHFRGWLPSSLEDFDLLFLVLSYARNTNLLNSYQGISLKLEEATSG